MNVETPSSQSSPHNHSLKIKGLFRRGLNLSSTDRNVIFDYLNAAGKELKGYEVEINKLKAAILSLENRRDLLKNKMDRYRSLLSPIHRLPTEVLEKIFIHDARAVLCPRVVPEVISLSMVCGRWREVICSTPSLWTNISLNVERWSRSADDATDGITRLTYVLQLFLDRSRSAPLKLDLHMRSSVLAADPTTKILDVLAPSMNRWRILDLNISPEIFEHPALQLLPQRLSSLQHVTLSSSLSDRHVNLFNKCPSLTSLVLHETETPYRFQREWPGIKTLEISLDASSATFVSSFLQVCPNLEKLSIWTSSTRQELESLIVISRLKSLDLTGYRLLSLFQYFSLSNLSTMTLDIHDEEEDIQIFAEFLSRSNCNITHLTLIPPDLRTDYTPVLSFLRLLPTVQELHLDVRANNGALFGTFLDQLFVGQLSSPLLPHLTDLTLIIDEFCYEEEPLVRAVKSRWLPDLQDPSEAGVTCLQSLKLEVLTYEFTPTLEPLLYLRDAGLRVEVF
ncbi:hypothetical protein E1B28_008281 [Marasmius oreades]|uniref:F-box domain-containing protein n=1 Tax=Marasmius oreades TaxID=181124 RepID=A0A9P7US84_9AGAR|nr:uncharacterized protein E1B28_008281 [Marasmius oreades]KAG7091880.1 hypothetical protein E1B28_008281 [Marasmius oreades]